MKCLEESSRYIAIIMELEGSALSWRTQGFGKCTWESCLKIFFLWLFTMYFFFASALCGEARYHQHHAFHLHLRGRRQISAVALSVQAVQRADVWWESWSPCHSSAVPGARQPTAGETELGVGQCRAKKTHPTSYLRKREGRTHP